MPIIDIVVDLFQESVTYEALLDKVRHRSVVLYGVLLGDPRNRVKSTQVFATFIENLDFSM